MTLQIKLILAALFSLMMMGLGAFTYHKFSPAAEPKVVEVEKTVFVDRIKEVKVKEKVKQDEVKTVIITKPDGTKIEEKTETKTATESEESVLDKETKKETVIAAANVKKNWGLGLELTPLKYAPKDLKSLDNYKYEVFAARRLFADLWLSASWDFTHKEAGFGLRLDF